MEALAVIDILQFSCLSAVLMFTIVKCVEIVIDMVWSIRVGNRFATAVRAEVDAREAVDIRDIERDFRRIQPIYYGLDRLALRAPLIARGLRAMYWAPGLVTILVIASAVTRAGVLVLPLIVCCTAFTTLILLNAPLKRFAFRGYDRYNRDILLGAWLRPGDTDIQADRAVRAVTAYFLWLVYVSVLGFGATYAWASMSDPTAFSKELGFPTSTFFSLGIVSTVGFVNSTAQSTPAQILVAVQVTTGPLILAWLLTEIAPHRAAKAATPASPPTTPTPAEAHRALAAAVIVGDDGKILLAHRRRTAGFRPGKWDLIGGHIEAGEDPRVAVAREVYEEVGIKVGALTPSPHARWIENGYDLRIWVVRDWSGKPRNYAKGQHTKVRFWSVREARRLRLGDPKYLALFAELAAARA